MDKHSYFKDVRKMMEITGKRVGHNVYIHWDAIVKFQTGYSIGLHDYLKRVADEIQIGHDWNVVKLSIKEFNVSFLHYPAFYKKFHPALKQSTKVGLDQMKSKSQKYINNRPILHRCETMMIPNTALQAQFCAMTCFENAHGLYDDVKIIGRESVWVDLLKKKDILEYLLNTQNTIAAMIRKAPSITTTIIPDAL